MIGLPRPERGSQTSDAPNRSLPRIVQSDEVFYVLVDGSGKVVR
jgi:hypothetical protein